MDQEEYDTVAVDEEEREAWSLSLTPPPVPPHAPRQAEENWSLEDDKYFDTYPEEYEIALKGAEERGFWPDEPRQRREIEEDPEHVQQVQYPLFLFFLSFKI